jgi:hypothetical protein
MPKIQANGIDIEYDCFGNCDAEAVRCPSNFAFQQVVPMPPLIADLHAC